jgi:hypothetical protein
MGVAAGRGRGGPVREPAEQHDETARRQAAQRHDFPFGAQTMRQAGWMNK